MPQDTEQTPLLRQQQDGYQDSGTTTVSFNKEGDSANPREWTLKRKMIQVVQIFFLALVCPMAASVFAPALDRVATTFHTETNIVLIGQSGFMMGLGTGPLLLAPMSETFGRRGLFVSCLAIFTLLQIPTALVQNVGGFIAVRTISGFFGSVGVANGGGSVFDMFETHQRAVVLGVYLIAPLFGPTLGPILGGLIVGSMDWRWIFWFTMIISGTVTTTIYFFLYETNATAILTARKNELQKQYPDHHFDVEGVSEMSIARKVVSNANRALRILTTQPIVLIMSIYQALIFSSLFSIYAQYQSLWSQSPYYFNKTQVGLAYLGPATGFIIIAIVCCVFIDTIYNYFARRNGDDGLPEYRLPLANIGAFLLPISLFWFGWSVQYGLDYPIPILATVFFGASQVAVFNPVQTYYIDAYGSSAASALAAGAFLRSCFGAVVPLFVGSLFDKLGYGWGTSIFAFISVLLMPAPLLFQKYGKYLRERFPFTA